MSEEEAESVSRDLAKEAEILRERIDKKKRLSL